MLDREKVLEWIDANVIYVDNEELVDACSLISAINNGELKVEDKSMTDKELEKLKKKLFGIPVNINPNEYVFLRDCINKEQKRRS